MTRVASWATAPAGRTLLPVKHTHLKKGGGTETHGVGDDAHPAEPGHKHDGLLPFQKKFGASEAELADVDRVFFAELSTADRNKMDSSTFAYNDEKGGHYPLNDAAHVRSAASYFPKGIPQDARAGAARKIKAAAKKFGVDLSADSAVMKFSEPVGFSIIRNEPISMAETLIPYLKVSAYNFDEYGSVDVTPEKLLSVKQHFDAHVRGEDLPIVDIDHLSPVFGKSAAVGWVTGLEADNPETPTELKARVKWNADGEAAIDGDKFRYTSPNLLRDWKDPLTGVVYPLVAAGVDVRTREAFDDSAALAVTNFPRMKDLGRIAAAEDGSRMVITSVGEAPGTENPVDAYYRLALAEDTRPECPTCHGDGHAPVAASITNQPAVVGMSESTSKESSNMSKPGTGAPATGTPPAADADDDKTKAADQAAADKAENDRVQAAETLTQDQRIAAAETRAAAAEQRAKDVEARLQASETAAAIGKTAERVNALLHTQRITPATHEKLSAAESISRLSMSESNPILEALEAAPVGAAIKPYAGVRGAANPVEAGDPQSPDRVKMSERLNELVDTKKMSFAEAAKQVAAEFAPARSQGGK